MSAFRFTALAFCAFTMAPFTNPRAAGAATESPSACASTPMRNSTLADDGAGTSLTTETFIDGSVDDAWQLFSTQAGLRKWAAPTSKVDFKVGGTIESNFIANGGLSASADVTTTILSYQPEHMISLKTASVPKDFPFADQIRNTWSVVYIDSISPVQTRIRIVGMGYDPSNADSQKMYDYFRSKQSDVQTALKAAVTNPIRHPDADAVLRSMKRLTGDWVHESTMPDGIGGQKPFRVHYRFTTAADGKGLLMENWIDSGKGMLLHGSGMIWETDTIAGAQVNFQNLSETGAVTRGAIIATDNKANDLFWDWRAVDLDGKVTPFQLTTNFDDDTHFTLNINQIGADGQPVVLIKNAQFEKVEKVPDRFQPAANPIAPIGGRH